MAKNELQTAIKALKERVAELRKSRKWRESDWNKRIAYLQKAKKDDLLQIDRMIRDEMRVLHSLTNK